MSNHKTVSTGKPEWFLKNVARALSFSKPEVEVKQAPLLTGNESFGIKQTLLYAARRNPEMDPVALAQGLIAAFAEVNRATEGFTCKSPAQALDSAPAQAQPAAQ